MKKNRQNVGRKIKSAGCIYIPGYQSCESESRLNLRSCLHDAIINSAPRVFKHIKKHELYIQCPSRIVKDTNMNGI